MKTTSFADMQCSIARSLNLVGSWWSLLIIRDAMMGARRFKHFEASLGIAKNTLTNRLNDLVEGGVLKRVRASDGSNYDEYQLTEMGRDLAPVMIAFAQWGDKWAAHENGPSTIIIDRETGERLPRVWPRRRDGDLMELREVGMEPANGAAPKGWRKTRESRS